MKTKSVTAVITGLKQAGINFISSLPSGMLVPLIQSIANDADFIHVPVANEEDAIAICAGASLVGNKPAFVVQNAGLVLATYALLDSLHWFGGFPILMVIDHRGDLGDSGGYIFTGYGVQVPRILESFHIPYTIVRESNKLTAEIVRVGKTVEASGKPAAVLLSGEAI